MIRIFTEVEASTVLGRSVDRVGAAMVISAPIVEDVRLRGDAALKDYRQRFDLVACDEPLYLDTVGELSADLHKAVDQASRNIQSFAEAQLPTSWMREFSDGRSLGQVIRPLDSVGVYVPAGRYPLISTLLISALLCALCQQQRASQQQTQQGYQFRHRQLPPFFCTKSSRLSWATSSSSFAFSTFNLPLRWIAICPSP